MAHPTTRSPRSSRPSRTSGRARRAKPRWQRRKDARPEEIVTAALEEFVERGFAVTRLEDVEIGRAHV